MGATDVGIADTFIELREPDFVGIEVVERQSTTHFRVGLLERGRFLGGLAY